MNNSAQLDVETALLSVADAAESQALSAGAVDNIRTWLTEPRYAEYTPAVLEHIAQQRWQELDDAFWTVIPFGTGGRRGRMYAIGCNVINERTIGESAAGLASYVRDHVGEADLSCGIAYDTRHNSVEFAHLCAEIMVAHGFRVEFLDEIRSTPELSFLVRYRHCACGIMVTASHNPPSDNAVKCYWSTGGQILPPHDSGVIDRVMQVDEIPRANYAEALAAGKIRTGTSAVDDAYIKAVLAERFPGVRDLKVIYSPLHGVGSTAVLPALAGDAFTDVEVFGPHAQPDGDFPNVPDHVANPENTRVFDSIIERARETGADLILATDPDCDRVGCAAPRQPDARGEWGTFTGNQIGSLLADYVLSQRKKTGDLTPAHYLVKTLVTSEMIRRIGESYGVVTHGNLLVGFKWIGAVMDEVGPDNFVLGAEESHGYLVGQYARDKDAAVAAMLLAELAAETKAAGQSLHEKMDALYWQHGYHAERLLNLKMAGSEGMTRMQALMQLFREHPPQEIGGLQVASVRDYAHGTMRSSDGETCPFDGPTGDLVMLELAAQGNYVAVRPSGTEPKVKFYLFSYVPAESLADLELTKREMDERLDKLESDLAALADTV